MFTVTIQYRDGSIYTHQRKTLRDAERLTEEECSWEGTNYAVIEGGEKGQRLLKKRFGDYFHLRC